MFFANQIDNNEYVLRQYNLQAKKIPLMSNFLEQLTLVATILLISLFFLDEKEFSYQVIKFISNGILIFLTLVYIVTFFAIINADNFELKIAQSYLKKNHRIERKKSLVISYTSIFYYLLLALMIYYHMYFIAFFFYTFFALITIKAYNILPIIEGHICDEFRKTLKE